MRCAQCLMCDVLCVMFDVLPSFVADFLYENEKLIR